MTTEALENVIFWLKKREGTFTSAKTAYFIRHPVTIEKVQAVQDIYTLLLSEAQNEHRLSIEYGGYLEDERPCIIFQSPL